MPKTYEPIATQTVGTATPTITFSSIPQTYTDIVVATAIQMSANVNVWMRFNSDTGSNYSYTTLQGNGSSGSSSRSSSDTKIQLDSVAYPYFTSTAFSPNIVHIMNYSNTTTYKTALLRSNNATVGVSLFAGLWRSTSAISTIAFTNAFPGSVNFAVGTTFTLYGVKSA
jgi:hypothetical protein